jgi:hypothetical protein
MAPPDLLDQRVGETARRRNLRSGTIFGTEAIEGSAMTFAWDAMWALLYTAILFCLMLLWM